MLRKTIRNDDLRNKNNRKIACNQKYNCGLLRWDRITICNKYLTVLANIQAIEIAQFVKCN